MGKGREDMPRKKKGEGANEQVEKALLQLATGYTVPLAKTFKLKQVEFDPDTGKKIAEREELAVGYDETHVSANTRAQMFWLTNRDPERWSSKPEERQEEDGEESGVVLMPEVGGSAQAGAEYEAPEPDCGDKTTDETEGQERL